jgi:hypothetical protein
MLKVGADSDFQALVRCLCCTRTIAPMPLKTHTRLHTLRRAAAVLRRQEPTCLSY